MTLREDNDGTIKVAYGDATTKRLKHVELRHFYIKQLIKKGLVTVKPVATADNVADVFTKPLNREKFSRYVGMLGLVLSMTQTERGVLQ